MRKQWPERLWTRGLRAGPVDGDRAGAAIRGHAVTSTTLVDAILAD